MTSEDRIGQVWMWDDDRMVYLVVAHVCDVVPSFVCLQLAESYYYATGSVHKWTMLHDKWTRVC